MDEAEAQTQFVWHTMTITQLALPASALIYDEAVVCRTTPILTSSLLTLQF